MKIKELKETERELLDFFKYLGRIGSVKRFSYELEEIEIDNIKNLLLTSDIYHTASFYRGQLELCLYDMEASTRIVFIKNILRAFYPSSVYLNYKTKTEGKPVEGVTTHTSAHYTVNVIKGHISNSISDEENVLQDYIIVCWEFFYTFFRSLDALCLSFDIDIICLQEEISISMYERDLFQKLLLRREGISLVEKEKVKTDLFKLDVSEEKAIEIFRFLVEGGFIQTNTSKVSFLYCFGYSFIKSPKIVWLGTRQQLRQILQGIKPTPCTMAEIERKVPFCFVDVKGHDMHLSKNKRELSSAIDAIQNFLSTFAK